MADYYPVLTRAISSLESNTAEARRAVYERARQAIVKQLRSYDPPLTESEITKERLGLEEAVRRIEAEARASAKAAPEPPPVSISPPPAPRPASPPPVAAPSPAPSIPDLPSAPTSPSPRAAGGDGFSKVHAAAAAAASLGAATASAQASASSTRAAFDPAARGATPPRTEPVIDRPRVPGPLPGGRAEPSLRAPGAHPFGDTPNLREPEETEEKSSRGKTGVLIALALVAALAAGGYFARDTILPLIGMGGQETASTAPGPKDDDRVGSGSAEAEAPQSEPPAVATPEPVAPAAPAAEAPAQPAPQSAPSAEGIVAQRAILYDEAPDQQGGVVANGTTAWRTEPVPGTPAELRLIGEVTIPDRGMTVTMTITRNLDQTLPASHVIEIGFTVPADFPNVGIGNVPGILFKETEDAGGSALKGMSVKVTKNLFWIGLEASPADREQNMQSIRNRGWIDIPILYDNGRRAVLTVEKGTPGERAFEAAFAAWDTTPPAGQP